MVIFFILQKADHSLATQNSWMDQETAANSRQLNHQVAKKIAVVA